MFFAIIIKRWRAILSYKWDEMLGVPSTGKWRGLEVLQMLEKLDSFEPWFLEAFY